jgi:hypothetical protein
MTGEVITLTPSPEVEALIARLSTFQARQVAARMGPVFAPKLTRWLVDQSQAMAGSGPFSKGWLAQPTPDGIQVTNSFGKAKFIEFPTKPHLIRPTKPGGVLAWMPGRGPFSAVKVSAKTKAKAGVVFAKVVHHPGTGGKYVFKTVMLGREPELEADLNAAVNDLLMGKAGE